MAIKISGIHRIQANTVSIDTPSFLLKLLKKSFPIGVTQNFKASQLEFLEASLHQSQTDLAYFIPLH